jgi:hypothetical protein
LNLYLWDFANGRDLYVDLSLVSTLCVSYRNIGAKEAGAAGCARRNEKLRKYSEQIEKVAFEPLMVESIWGWNLEEKTLLRDMRTSFSICKLMPKRCRNGSVSFDHI